MSLDKLARQFFRGTAAVPNLAWDEQPVERFVLDSSAALAAFVNEIQESGGDTDAWDEEQWTAVLVEQFDASEDEIPELLEMLASWGVVDNPHY